MMNERELESYFERHGFSPTAQRAIRRIREMPPERRTESGKDNVDTRYSSRKMGVVIQAESHTNELPALVQWEFDKTTHEIYDQPPRLKLRYRNAKGRMVSYMATMDYFLLREEPFAGWIECKTEEWLQARADEGSTLYVRGDSGGWRCPPGEQAAAEYDLGFRVVSSADINWNLHRNVEFIADYLHVECPIPDADQVRRIRESMEGQAWVTLQHFVDVGCDMDVVYKLIADRTLYFNFERDLISEPEKALVFRDQVSAEAYRLHHESSKLPAVPSLRPVQIDVGSSLMWDGVPWRIVNIAPDNATVYLDGPNQVITSMQRSMLEQLIHEKVVTGFPEKTTPEIDEAERIMRSASPVDYEHALLRYYSLFPETADGEVPVACERAIRKWKALYRNSQNVYGNGFIGLIPGIHKRGNRDRKIDNGVIVIMNEVIDELYATAEAKTKTVCWGEVIQRCEEAGLVPPSEKAFRAEIERRLSQLMKETREGDKAAYPTSDFYWFLEQSTPKHGDRPFHIGHIDHTQLDLQFVNARTGKKMGKAWLTVLLDANTRMVLAWVILFDSPSYRSCMLVIRECIKRHGRIPQYLVLDKGAEFRSIYFECLLARLETHKKTRPASKPRFGSVIERFFGMNNTAFIHNLRGNNKALQNPRAMSKSHDPRKLAVWTIADFNREFGRFVDEAYSNMDHSALGITPREAMALGMAHAGMRKHKLTPYTRDFIIMCMPTTRKSTVKVVPGRGVKIGYVFYWTAEFRNGGHAGEEVAVRYDPFDMSTAFVWLKNRWVVCQSEYADTFRGRSEKEIAALTKEIRERFKQEGARRAVNAQVLALFLRGTALTEQSLMLRDLDRDVVPELPSQPEPALLPSPDEPERVSPWANLNVRILGDFE